MIVIKKLIYSIVAKDYAVDIFIIGDGLFFTIQFVIANIYTLLTSRSVLSVKTTIIRQLYIRLYGDIPTVNAYDFTQREFAILRNNWKEG